MSDTTVNVTLPEMGESVTEGSIVEWRKKVGDYVAEGDTLVDVTTDKVDVEVPATASGVIAQILAGEGQTVAVGAALAQIDTSNGNGAAPPSNGAAAPSSVAAPTAPSGPPRPVDVTLPEMGESVTEGSIVGYRVKPGDFVAEGDAIVDVTTDKVDVEVPAPASGVVLEISAKEGDTVAVGAKLAVLDADAKGASATASPSPSPRAEMRGAGVEGPPPVRATGDVVASQPARRFAKKRDVDLALVRGSGRTA